ncbi:hypothetical protein [Labedaea rhizosphaerae]|uniref:Uncharacterized protein n=1 Tax=Labedaea rhizosphaerae TaxID=598644 RepID=A0A4R6SPS9_LABRH|nr:hypothetical protein [Labedaea rhizosphaerae]TDQ05961.1 hypothetical protein EV186_1011939 [Labedaea rhizosphaerae]
MGEGFYVDPHYLYGFGDMLFAETKRDNQSSLCRMRDHARRHCMATDKYTGLMSVIKGAVSRYANSLHNRLDDMAAVGWGTANELQHATWVYVHKEAENSKRLHDGSYDNAPDAAAEPFPATHPKLGKPTVSIDWPAMFDEFGKDLKDVDWFVSDRLGWQVHRELIVDITGDWTALANAGHALIAIGDAADTVSANIKTNLVILDQHWDGASAQSALALLTRFHEGIQEEAPINRTVGRIYMYVADEIKKVAGKIISTLDGLIQKLKDILADYWEVPWPFGSCVCEAYDLVDQNKHLFDGLRTLLQNVRVLLDDTRRLLDALQDPVKAAANVVPGVKHVQESFDIVNGAVEKSTKVLAIEADVDDLADPHEFVNAPHEQYRLPGDAEAPA